jgi:hypothetical protein
VNNNLSTQAPVTNKRQMELDLLLVGLVRELQKDGSSEAYEQIVSLLEPQLQRVAEIQLLAPDGCETLEDAWHRVHVRFYLMLLFYKLDHPQDRMPMRLSFALLDELRETRERDHSDNFSE